MKKLGMIGGTSWYSTVEYYKQINEGVSKQIGKASNPELIIHSINIDVMRRQVKDEINDKYLNVALKLQKAGAEGIIICANTPHMAYDFVQPKIDIPILHIAEAVGEEASKNNLNTLGLLGNRPTMTGNFIPEILNSKFNIQTIIPDEVHINKIHKYVSEELTQGKFTEEAREFFLDMMNHLAQKGADGIILGCTELPILLNETNYNLPMLGTTQLHVKKAVDFILN